MKYIVEFYYIKSDHILATPELDHKRYIESDNYTNLEIFIGKQKDQYGNYFKKRKYKLYGFDFVSKQGAIKIKKYISQKFEKI